MTRKTYNFLTSPLFYLSLMLLSLLLSLLIYAVGAPDVKGRVFFFPANTGSKISVERRAIPAGETEADNLRTFIEELFLGPETLELTYLVPRGTRVRNVAVVNRTAYIDFDYRILDADQELPLGFDEAIENLQYNILYNFKRLDEVVFTIEGRQVHSPYYSGFEATE